MSIDSIAEIMMKTNIRKIGNSSGLIIPAIILKKMDLSEGDEIEIIEENNRFVLEPVKKTGKYTLNELIAECNEDAAGYIIDEEFSDAANVGKENI
ncbi:MAG: AbrB/MazE/SpoVT family DNA-binding domain-containing protein [Gammaproteobacteria bacterium]|nr:AbrB/MazE/SpoVT family DNA-binding domain-containing protein [Gammaproteobacteria bacterium]